MTSHSLKKIITSVTRIQNQITLEEIRLASRSAGSFSALQARVFDQITFLVKGIDQKLSATNLTGADLAIRSRRGYQWLKFLSAADHLSSHLDALQRINLYLMNEKGKNGLRLAATLYHQGPLFKVHQQEEQRKIIVQESFLRAPDRILKALLDVAFDPSSKAARIAIQDYTYTKEYQRIRTRLEYCTVPPGSFSAGQFHHLGQCFQRVNQKYFQGNIHQPHLVWGGRMTQRKFGHYQWDTDTVMVSSSLDQEWVPEMVVDFVIYHELLHKKLGTKRVKHNRMAHTKAFREAEKQFDQAEKAQQLLNRIARKNA